MKADAMRRPLTATLILVCFFVGSSAAAEALDGLYKPSGSDWSCSPEFIGVDGGALAIQSGVLDGLENRCDLTEPRPAGQGTRYTAVCSGEGSPYRDEVTLTKAANGVMITRDGRTVYWVRCGSVDGLPASPATAAAPPGVSTSGQWTYDGQSASVFANGFGFALACEPLTPSSTYPLATFYGYCPACMYGDTTDLTISIDNSFSRTYLFEMISRAAGWQSELDYAPTWYDDPITTLMAGQTLTISDGTAVISRFPLDGSSAALTALRDDCN